MLIRSQNKEVLIVFESLLDIEVSGGVISVRKDRGWCCLLGEYSTKTKALKALDMIQETYGGLEYTKYVIPEVCKSLSMKPRTEENIAHAEEIGEMLKKGVTFQMPEDGSVEV